MFGLQPGHLIIILIIALIVFGPKRLPELGKSLGRAIIEFKNATRDPGKAAGTQDSPDAGAEQTSTSTPPKEN